MKKAPRLTGKDIIKILGVADFKVVRVKGSVITYSSIQTDEQQ